MKALTTIYIALLAVGVTLGGCIDESTPEPETTNNTQNDTTNGGGDGGNNNGGNDNGGNNMGNTNPAPSFSLTSVDGGTVSLSSFSGKPLVIFFFGDECPNCKGVAPSIESKIANKYSSSTAKVIGIDTWNGNEASVKKFRSDTGVSFDLLLEGSGVAKNYGSTYDRLVVVDASGNIAHKSSSNASSDIDKVIQVVDGLLK